MKTETKEKTELNCLEPYCHEKVVCFDTHDSRLYCKKHLREMVSQSIRYNENIHIEFIRDA